MSFKQLLKECLTEAEHQGELLGSTGYESEELDEKIDWSKVSVKSDDDIYKELVKKAKKAIKGKDDEFTKGWIKTNVYSAKFRDKLAKDLGLNEDLNEGKDLRKLNTTNLDEKLSVTDAIMSLTSISNYVDDIRKSGGVKQIRYDKKKSQEFFDRIEKLEKDLEDFYKSYR